MSPLFGRGRAPEPDHEPARPPAQLEGPVQRLTIFIGEGDRYRHTPLWSEILRRAQAVGIAGATAVRGIEGFGASRRVHTTRIVSLSEDLPVIISMIDVPERISMLLWELDELITEGLAVVEEVNVMP